MWLIVWPHQFLRLWLWEKPWIIQHCHLTPLTITLPFIHYSCLFLGMRKFPVTVLILNCKAYVIIPALPDSWGAFSSAAMLPIYQLITGCKSQPFILIPSPSSWKIEERCLSRGCDALRSHEPFALRTRWVKTDFARQQNYEFIKTGSIKKAFNSYLLMHILKKRLLQCFSLTPQCLSAFM